MHQTAIVIKSIAKDKRMVSYGIILLALHIVGVLFLYRRIPEFDNVPHTWFGYVLSEYSSRGAASIGLQLRLTEKFKKRGWKTITVRQADFLLRLAGFLLIGGLFWEWSELAFSPLVGQKPDSFFAFPLSLRNIDGALDVTVGVVGAILAFLINDRRTQ